MPLWSKSQQFQVVPPQHGLNRTKRKQKTNLGKISRKSISLRPGEPKMTVKRMLSRAEVKKLSAVSTKLDDVNSAKKGDDGEAKCPRSHPPTCRAFDDKGPDGCKSEPCPKGKYHRKVCAKLLSGECQRKAGNCYWYHPPLLSQKIKAQQKKRKEEEEKLEMRQMLEEMRSLRQPQVMQFPVQMPYPFYTMPQPAPTPFNSGSKKQ